MTTHVVTRYETAGGRTIYTFPVQAFVQLVANIYIIDDGNGLTLVDCGSGMEQSNNELLAGFETLGSRYGKAISFEAINHIVITHGHMDHFGGLPFVRLYSKAPIGVHSLDRRVLSNYEERVLVASRRLKSFLERAGVSIQEQANLMAMYMWAKDSYRSTAVQFALEEKKPLFGDIPLFHVPGHCPGQVCLLVDDIMLTADHVLSRTTPHQAPESITNNMGLGHYLESLAKIEKVEGVRLALGGHEKPMEDLCGRIQEIQQVHEVRLNKILDLCREPKSIAEISKSLFGKVSSYHVLLAIEETGAHVEYLYQRGELVASNLDEIQREERPVIAYQWVQ
jgi:glyoxylase-like metal-dependent hydrolase (beta-lactamase superfamily II)